ncbi:MAG: type I phosphomannose isomerase catalytic subunit [Bacteroidota bacterium]
MKNLYPLKFKPILKDKLWGGDKLKKILNKKEAGDHCGESWEISGIENNESVVINGYLKDNNLRELTEIYMGELVGEKIFEHFEFEFPLLIKFIDAKQPLSIQVHPDDELAQQRLQQKGKTEAWYIIDSEPGSKLISGFKKNMDKERYLQSVKNNTLPDIVKNVNVNKDDVFFLPAGRIHSIGGGILLAEIQQASDITYRIYDWNRKDANGKTRELHTQEALDAIHFNDTFDTKTTFDLQMNQTVNIINCDYFVTNILCFDTPVKKDYLPVDSFIIYICLEGSCKIFYDNDSSDNEELKKGETILIPAVCNDIILNPGEKTKILEVFARAAHG